MFRFLRNLPIQRKLMAIAMVSSGVALGLACVGFASYDAVTFRRGLVQELSTTALLAGANSAAGLTFGDSDSVEQTLRTLEADPHIIRAAVYGGKGNLFASFRRSALESDAPSRLENAGHRFLDDRLDLWEPIVLDGETIGTILVVHDLDEVRDRLVRYAAIVGVLLVGSSLVAFAVAAKLQRIISGPLSDLARTAASVAEEKNFSLRAVKHGDDELGQLIDGFNAMLEQIGQRDSALRAAHDNLERRVEERTAQLSRTNDELKREVAERLSAQKESERVHRQLLEVSRQAGMAEVATGVLHNVGNVLNSVNVSATLVADSLRVSKVDNLVRAVALLREHEAELASFLESDPRGKHLIDYLEIAGKHLDDERGAALREVGQLQSKIEHIKHVVAMQQSYARVSGVVETVSAIELMEDAVRINAMSLERHRVRLVREYGPALPEITVDKHKVLQILVNLICNAKDACEDSSHDDRQLTLRVDNGDGLRIEVADNGVGIEPENLVRIFSHGFTTRRNGHGFGLHSGALTAKELGGSLTAESGGHGKGATFVLELPVRPPERASSNA
jgi:two-component system, NtrC family, sensor kinase